MKRCRDEQNTRGLIKFIEDLQGEGLKLVEIGSYAGESMKLFAQSGKFAAIYCVDPWQDSSDGTQTYANMGEVEAAFDSQALRFPGLVHKVKATSAEAARLLSASVWRTDVVYLDGLHDYENVAQDIDTWRGFVRETGTIAGHDWHEVVYPGVVRAVAERFGQPDAYYPDTTWAVRNRPRPPQVTCVCITHGRPYMVIEAVESFRRQTLAPDLCRLLIVNDCPEQTLTCELDRVRIVNTATMWRDVSDKFNDAVAEVDTPYVAWWEDDDISLPHRLTHSLVMKQATRKAAWKQGRAWYSESNVLKARARNLFFGSVLFERDYYIATGGANHGEPADMTAWNNMHDVGDAASEEPLPEETFFLYRWGMVHHDSGVAGTNADRFTAFRANTLAHPAFVGGTIELRPQWRRDYLADVARFLAELRADPANCPDCADPLEFDRGDPGSYHEPGIDPCMHCTECGFDRPLTPAEEDARAQ